MLFRADCQWCGDRVRAYQPSRRREFLDEHTASCGASGNLRWIVYLRAQRDAAGTVPALDQRTVDLTDRGAVALPDGVSAAVAG